MALSTALIHSVRGRPPLLAVGIKSLIHSHSSSVRSLGYVFSCIHPCYTTHEHFSHRPLDPAGNTRADDTRLAPTDAWGTLNTRERVPKVADDRLQDLRFFCAGQ